MGRFWVGTYEAADSDVQQAWLFFIVDLLGAAAGVTVKEFAEKRLSKIQFCAPEMEALVRWGLRVFLESRWIPEYEEDQAAKNSGKEKLKRVKRKGDTASKQEVDVFDADLETTFKNRKSDNSKTWEKAIMEEARSRLLIGGHRASVNSISSRPAKKIREVRPLTW